MTRILPFPVWVGHGGEGHDSARLLEAEIEAVVELAWEEPSFPTLRDMTLCRIPLLDGVGNRPELLVLAIRTVASLIVWQIPTLVCCYGGMSRSPAVVAAALALVRNEPAEDCLKFVARHHPTDVLPGFWNEITGVLPRVAEIGHLPS